jgi:peptidoglycan/LPS O-acetylase OafA/YrhL
MSSSLSRSAALHRIPSLDGLRAVSILLVVGLHTLQRYGGTHPLSSAWLVLFNGGTGVFIFFEISGFLITTLLLKEDEKRGSVSLTGFYRRRAFRILPPLYLYIGVVLLLGWAGRLKVAPLDVTGSAFFFHNIYFSTTWSLEHLWSISIEEQFYLVWPFILAWCLRTKGVPGRWRAALLPGAVVVLSPLATTLMRRSSVAALRSASLNYICFGFIMFGCLVALLIWFVPAAVILLCSLLSTRYGNRFDLTLGSTLNGLAIAMLLLWCTRNAGTMAGKLLNSRAMAQIGVLSYSIYLWQTLFLHEGNEAVFAAVPWLGRFPGNWIGCLLMAAASYYLVEQPSLRLRDWLARRFRQQRAVPAA